MGEVSRRQTVIGHFGWRRNRKDKGGSNGQSHAAPVASAGRTVEMVGQVMSTAI